jgi:hypothetical protein
MFVSSSKYYKFQFHIPPISAAFHVAIIVLQRDINVSITHGKDIDHQLKSTTILYKSQLTSIKSIFPLINDKLSTQITQNFLSGITLFLNCTCVLLFKPGCRCLFEVPKFCSFHVNCFITAVITFCTIPNYFC